MQSFVARVQENKCSQRESGRKQHNYNLGSRAHIDEMARKKVTLSYHEGLFYAAIERLPKESAPGFSKILAKRTLDSRSFQKTVFFPQNYRSGMLTKWSSTLSVRRERQRGP